jgi:glycosyltransferase involved in cell wall biosynthesis
MRLLFITQKIHQNDDDLAFVILWIHEFIRQGFEVEVICLEKRDFDGSFPVHSLGKERGASKLSQIVKFLSLIMRLKYDRVFVHMNPEYFTLGGWWWSLYAIPSYFWYTHYTMSIHVRIAALVSRRMFAATKQSLPQFEGNPKKVILGHGIDVDFWLRDLKEMKKLSESELLMVHRLSRSKRAEIAIRALALLPKEDTLTINGRDIDAAYYKELKDLVRELRLSERVRFAGPLPMHELKEVYPRYRVMVNMASETIDKTMLEAMLFGVYPVTTPGNSIAIGLPAYPEDDRPESIAAFIAEGKWRASDQSALEKIVREKHSLAALVRNMSSYISSGT